MASNASPANASRHVSAIAALMSIAVSLPALAADCGNGDGFEDLADGDPVDSREIGGVEVAVSASNGAAFETRTYESAAPIAFTGASGQSNTPLSPLQVSGVRFISTARDAVWNFHQVQPIVFELSEPVNTFGLTTIDLLEEVTPESNVLSLIAYDADGNVIDVHARQGPQGESGVVLAWQVHSFTTSITRVELAGALSACCTGYGIDDVAVCIECPADFNGDTVVNSLDVLTFLNAFTSGDAAADCNGDEALNSLDVLCFLNVFVAGCV